MCEDIIKVSRNRYGSILYRTTLEGMHRLYTALLRARASVCVCACVPACVRVRVVRMFVRHMCKCVCTTSSLIPTIRDNLSPHLKQTRFVHVTLCLRVLLRCFCLTRALRLWMVCDVDADGWCVMWMRMDVCAAARCHALPLRHSRQARLL